MRRTLKRARRVGVGLAVAAAVSVLRHLPHGLLRRGLGGAMALLGPLGTGARAQEGLALAFGEALDERARARRVRAMCRHLGRLAAEVLCMHRRDGAFFDRLVDPGSYVQVVERELAAGRGLIGLSGHLGNWELLAHQSRRLAPGRFRTVVGKQIPNRAFHRMVEASRRRSGLTTIYRHESPRRILRVLAANEAVGLVPDQDVDALGGVFVEFFGRPAYTPLGPAWLSYRSGAPILPLFLVREGDGLRFHLEEVVRPRRGAGDRQAELERITVEWSTAVERVIRRYPDQWVWFHRRWRTTPERLARRGRSGHIRGPALPTIQGTGQGLAQGGPPPDRSGPTAK